MPTLLQINVTANEGSTGRIAEQIGQIAIDHGWLSYIAYGRETANSTSNLIKVGSVVDVFEHYAENRIFDNEGLASRNATKKMIKRIKELQPDIIHLHNIHDHWLNYRILFNYLRSVEVPVVWTYHDCWAITGGCSYFDSIGCNKWQKCCSGCPMIKYKRRKVLFDRSKRNFLLKKQLFTSLPNMIVVPVSIWLQNIVNQSFLKNSRIHYIYNGIDTNIFVPKSNQKEVRLKYNIHTPYMLIGVASKWSKRKGYDDYIKLSQMLSNAYTIALVGLTDRQKRNLPSNVIGINKTECVQELADLYSAADVVLNLSVEETFGLTTVEGMSCGTPGIVYNCTASPELITENTGYVVNREDIQSVANAVQTIITNGKDYYSSACRNWVLKNFRKEDKYKEYLELYNTLLNS